VGCLQTVQATSNLCEWPGTFSISLDSSALHLSRLSFTDVASQVISLVGGVSLIEACSFTRCGGSTGRGGAIGVSSGDATITDCIFVDNSAGDYGGAMFLYPEATSIQISGCTFQGNSARTGDAVDVWGGWMSSNPPASLKWRADGYSNKDATSDLQPFSYKGCTTTCANGMVMHSGSDAGCHNC
jgi:hypothetical protein